MRRAAGRGPDADDFYFDAFAQVHMDSWLGPRDAGRRRRVLRLPAAGMGTSLALVGAYLLAGELGPRTP